MTVLIQVSQQSYTPQTLNVPFTLAPGFTRATVSCTRVTWPEGQVGRIDVTFPDGRYAGGMGFEGGTIIGKDGSVSIRSGFPIQLPQGQATLPAGQYNAAVQILQPVTTAVLVEAF